MIRAIRIAALGCVLVLFLFAKGDAAAAGERETVTVMTSFPASLYEPFREAFEASQTRYRLRILNRKTTSALSHVLEPSRMPVDVFWASAPDAFELLSRQGRLARITRTGPPVPEKVGQYPIDDPEGAYLGFALAGYGLIWNRTYLEREGLAVPARLEDLSRPAYRDHLGISAPSRSGTTHLIVEILLQRLGWEEGWAAWLEIGGNLATITARSYGVPDGVVRGRFGLGLTIDFLGRNAADQSSGNASFSYLDNNIFLPANIAVMREAPQPDGAHALVDFVLGEEGQRLLLRPDIGRLPVMPALYEGEVPGDVAPFAEAGEAAGRFDPILSSRRYELVNLLFDELITYSLYERRKAWNLIHAAEARPGLADDPVASFLVAEARALAVAVPVSADEAADEDFNEGLKRRPRGTPMPDRQIVLEAQWRAFARENLDAAATLANSALARLDAGTVTGEAR